MPNRKVVELAIRLGLACGSRIADRMHYARKNYLSRPAQGLSDHWDTTPICTGGEVMVPTPREVSDRSGWYASTWRRTPGRAYTMWTFNTLVDLNQAGVPLVEIVSET